VPTFGLQIPNFHHADVADVDIFDHACEHAAAAEASGFTSVWVMDHLVAPPAIGGADQPLLEAYTTLAGVAARTRHVALGALVSPVVVRSPALLAKMVTTIDVMSHGRAVLGLGAGWFAPEHRRLGFAFPSAAERLDRLEEAVLVCRAMFREEEASFDGRYYRIREVRHAPRPVRPEGPPILIGGGGERRTLRLVAQHADMCNVSGSPETLARKLAVLRRHCDELGRDLAEITTTRLGMLVVTPDADETARVRSFLGGVVGEEFSERFTVGERDDVLREVERFAATGVDSLIFSMPMSDPDTVVRTGDLLVARFS